MSTSTWHPGPTRKKQICCICTKVNVIWTIAAGLMSSWCLRSSWWSHCRSLAPNVTGFTPQVKLVPVMVEGGEKDLRDLRNVWEVAVLKCSRVMFPMLMLCSSQTSTWINPGTWVQNSENHSRCDKNFVTEAAFNIIIVTTTTTNNNDVITNGWYIFCLY